MRKRVIIMLVLFLAVSCPALAIRINDSTNKASLSQLKTISTNGSQNALGLPVGSIIAWPGAQPLNSTDSAKYLECNGQTFDKSKYPELYAVLGISRVPDLNEKFLRGTTDGSAVLTYKEDTIKSHETDIVPHTHGYDLDFSGNVSALGHSDTVYVPGVNSASDKLTVQVTEEKQVKVGTERYVCGTKKENYQCNCETNSYACGTETRSHSYDCNCYTHDVYDWVQEQIWDHCNSYGTDYGTGQSWPCMTTPLASRYDRSQCANKPGCHSYRIEKVYKKVRSYDVCETCYETYQATKYCSEKTCETCTRTVKKYCTRDVFETQQEQKAKELHVVSINTTQPILSPLTDAHITGQINDSDVLHGVYNGATETAPKHTYVRYFIRAIP